MPWWGDRPGTGDIVHVVDARHGNLPRPRRGGRGNASPLQGVGFGADQQRMAVDLPRLGGAASSCRGQAVPDPPAR
jgi:hypothetical protein